MKEQGQRDTRLATLARDRAVCDEVEPPILLALFPDLPFAGLVDADTLDFSLAEAIALDRTFADADMGNDLAPAFPAGVEGEDVVGLDLYPVGPCARCTLLLYGERLAVFSMELRIVDEDRVQAL